MKKYFLEYLAFLDAAMSDPNTDYARLMKIHKEKTAYFQHERFVHLIVTVLFAICTVACFLTIAVSERVMLIPLALLLLALLIPYISHYYFLENNTQKLYKYYDQICEKLESEDL
jgi:hypothetical protein